MGKGRRAVDKIGKKKQGVFIGSKREIVTTMDPAWFVVQSLIFSSGHQALLVLVTVMVTTVTVAPFQWFHFGTIELSALFGVTAQIQSG